jgi:hypothetical protein
MRTFLKLLLAIVVLLVVGGAAIYFTGNVMTAIAYVGGPKHGWDPSLKAPPPDYAKQSSWAALPGVPSPADFVPAGVPVSSKDKQVDVFFIHPTGYLHGADWNSPLDPNSKTEENTKWMMANQASVFNGCCNVYAPRYREATIFRYFGTTSAEIVTQSMDLAYGDVDRAFTYFLEHYSRGRPFIIASHSQGSEHAFRLIQQRIDGTPLATRMVAAYILGGGVTDDDMAHLRSVHACNSPVDLHCVIHWRTYGEGAAAEPNKRGKLLCTNPLTWLRDGARAPASLHKGAVQPSGRFQIDFLFQDVASGVQFKPLEAPVRAWTWAECRDGQLFVADQKGTPFGRLDAGGKNYHGLDYPLFAMDIRENAEARAEAYVAAEAMAPAQK